MGFNLKSFLKPQGLKPQEKKRPTLFGKRGALVAVCLVCGSLVIGGAMTGVFSSHASFAAPTFQQISFANIDVHGLEIKLSSPNPPFLLDVREASEFAENKIENATLIPLGTLPSRVGELPKDKPIVVYCRSGNRSVRAASFLVENGFKNVTNLSGGMNAWLTR